MIKVDLNCDLGESFGAYKMGMDDKVIPLISSCNIACGYHASDPMVMQKTVAMAKEAGIGIGAHPGYPDLMGFGRRNMNVSPKEAAAYVTYQLGALYAFAKAAGVKLQHVKPHGALYNMAGKDYKLALEIAEAVQDFDSSLILMGLAGSESVIAAQDIGLPVAREVFADRAYMPDGSLVPRNREGAVIHDEELAISRVIRMVKEHKVTAIDGKDIEIVPDSICVHGDNEKALVFVTRIREALEAEGIEIAPLSEVVRRAHHPKTDAGIRLWITRPRRVPASMAIMPAPTIGRSAMLSRPRRRLIARTTRLFTQRNAWMVARYSFLLLVAGSR